MVACSLHLNRQPKNKIIFVALQVAISQILITIVLQSVMMMKASLSKDMQKKKQNRKRSALPRK